MDLHLRVLVVDDDPSSLGVVTSLVAGLGHECTATSDGVEAWYLQRREPFDVVITDWVMPRMSGLDLCRRIRSVRGDHYTYVLFTTGMADKSNLLEGIRAGADDAMAKPIDIDELEARLLTAARVCALHRRLARQNVVLRKDSERSFTVARTDPLTGAGNRLRLEEDLARLAADGSDACLAMCDVDDFKAYNDHFGHIAGDDALRRIAHALRESLRRDDSLYRYGGEEFLVLLPGQNTAQARSAMERARGAIEALALPQSPAAGRPSLTLSIGISQRRLLDHPNWLQRADEALYRAKRAGRNRVEAAPDDAQPAAAAAPAAS